MPVLESDIELRYTAPGAASGNTSPGTAAGSLGRYVSTTGITSGALHNVFDAVTAAENAANDVEYRCIAVLNTDATDTWGSVTAWVSAQVAGGATMAIGLDPAGVVNTNSVSAQGAVVPNESTAPDGVSFSAPGAGSPLSVATSDRDSSFSSR